MSEVGTILGNPWHEIVLRAFCVWLQPLQVQLRYWVRVEIGKFIYWAPNFCFCESSRARTQNKIISGMTWHPLCWEPALWWSQSWGQEPQCEWAAGNQKQRKWFWERYQWKAVPSLFKQPNKQKPNKNLRKHIWNTAGIILIQNQRKHALMLRHKLPGAKIYTTDQQHTRLGRVLCADPSYVVPQCAGG